MGVFLDSVPFSGIIRIRDMMYSVKDPYRLDQGDVLSLADVPRALEHHVLEQVGEAGLALDLVLRADVVPEVHRRDGREMVLGDDQPEAVGQARLGEGNLGNEHPRMLAQRGQTGIAARARVRERPSDYSGSSAPSMPNGSG